MDDIAVRVFLGPTFTRIGVIAIGVAVMGELQRIIGQIFEL